MFYIYIQQYSEMKYRYIKYIFKKNNNFINKLYCLRK